MSLTPPSAHGFCVNCGAARIGPEAGFCPRCGAPLPAATAAPPAPPASPAAPPGYPPVWAMPAPARRRGTSPVVKFIVVFFAVLIAGSLLVSLGNRGGSPSAGESGPTSAPYSSGAGIVPPGAQATAVASTATFPAVPDLCQLLPASKAAEIMGPVEDITADDTNGSSFDNNGVRYDLSCEWNGHDDFGARAGYVWIFCHSGEGSLDQIAADVPNAKQSAMSAGMTLKPATNIGTEAFLATHNDPDSMSGEYFHHGPATPQGIAELAFRDGPWVFCELQSDSMRSSGDAQGDLLLGLASQIVQLTHV